MNVVVLACVPVACTGLAACLGAFADPYRRAMRDIVAVRAAPVRSQSLDAADAALGPRPRARERALAWVEERISIGMLLRKAGIRQTTGRFLATASLYVLGMTALGLAVDVVVVSASVLPTAPIHPATGVVLGLSLAGLKFVDLPRAVHRRRRALDDAMAEVLIPLTIVSATGAIGNRVEALALFSSALDDPTLAHFLQRPEAFGEVRDDMSVDFRALIPDGDRMNDEVLFRTIGETYDVEVFSDLAHAVHQYREQNRTVEEAIGAAAARFQAQHVEEDEERIDIARTAVNIPMVFFLLLVFAAILVPMSAIITGQLR